MEKNQKNFEWVGKETTQGVYMTKEMKYLSLYSTKYVILTYCYILTCCYILTFCYTNKICMSPIWGKLLNLDEIYQRTK